MSEEFEKWWNEVAEGSGTTEKDKKFLFVKEFAEVIWQAATEMATAKERARCAEVARKVSEELLWAANTEMEGYSYFGSNKGVPQDEFEDISIKIAAAIEGGGTNG